MSALRIARILTLAASIALAAASARADIFAATCSQGPTSQDIAIFNASLGAPIALPTAVNTPDRETDPSISSDGRRLAFRRSGPSGSQFMIVVDLATGQSASLFTGFEVAQNAIFGSTITPDGTTVATGRRARQVLSTFWYPVATLTSLATFPSGPFSRTTLSPTRVNYGGMVDVLDVATGGNLFALQIRRGTGPVVGEIVLAQRDGSASLPLRSTSLAVSQPALAANSPASVLFVQKEVFIENGISRFRPGDIAFRPATIASFVGTPTRLGLGVSTAQDESQPALTADGRYVGFVRDDAAGGNDRLFIWDSQTQTLLNSNGIDLGRTGSATSCGSLSLYTRTVLASSVISRVGTVNATLLQASSIGIFVQRIVGKTKVLGRKAYQLETVGRVPLGAYGAGNVFTHWDFAVGGEPLPPGFYQVTVRAVDTDVVRELGQPQVLWIDARGGAHMLGKDSQ